MELTGSVELDVELLDDAAPAHVLFLHGLRERRRRIGDDDQALAGDLLDRLRLLTPSELRTTTTNGWFATCVTGTSSFCALYGTFWIIGSTTIAPSVQKHNV